MLLSMVYYSARSVWGSGVSLLLIIGMQTGVMLSSAEVAPVFRVTSRYLMVSQSENLDRRGTNFSPWIVLVC